MNEFLYYHLKTILGVLDMLYSNNIDRDEIVSDAEKYLILSMIEGLEPVVVDRAKDSKIWDVNGKEYVDFFSGISVVNIGHSREEIIEAVIHQLRKYVHVCTYVYYVPPAIMLAKKLAEITPGRISKTFFSNSGAEANECAMKLARKFTGKREFMALMGSFHGRTLATLSVTGQSRRKKPPMGPFLPGVTFAPIPYCYRAPFKVDSEEECAKIYAELFKSTFEFSTSRDVAAFIVEPVLGEGGIIPLPKDYLRIIKEEVLNPNNILLIVDEVQTGFGRTGKMFAIEHYGIEPDIMAMAKGIAAGFPLGACSTREEIADSFEPGDHLSTFGGNPISAVAALKNIELMIREKVPERAASLGQHTIKRLREAQESLNMIGDVRGLGLMIGVELVKDRRTKKPAVEEAKKVRILAREAGVLVGRGGITGSVIRVQPPLTISRELLDRGLDILIEAISKVEKEM